MKKKLRFFFLILFCRRRFDMICRHYYSSSTVCSNLQHVYIIALDKRRKVLINLYTLQIYSLFYFIILCVKRISKINITRHFFVSYNMPLKQYPGFTRRSQVIQYRRSCLNLDKRNSYSSSSPSLYRDVQKCTPYMLYFLNYVVYVLKENNSNNNVMRKIKAIDISCIIFKLECSSFKIKFV